MAPNVRLGRRALAAALVLQAGWAVAGDPPPAAPQDPPPPVRVNDRPWPNPEPPAYVTPAMMQHPDPPLPDLLPQQPPGPAPGAEAPSGPEPEPTKLIPVAPPGFTGPSGIVPVEIQTVPNAVPIEDRWRIPFPFWDRSQLGWPRTVDYPYRPTRGFL